MKIFKKKLIAMVFVCSTSTSLFSFVSTNFFRPDDLVTKFNIGQKDSLCVGVRVESGSRKNGRNVDGCRRSILALYDDTESVVKMVKNPIGQAEKAGAQDLFQLPVFAGGTITDDGVRGHVGLQASFSQTNFLLQSNYMLPIKSNAGNFYVGFYLPIVSKKIDGLLIDDKTKQNFAGDQHVKKFIDDLKNNLEKYGALKLTQAEESMGLGDAVLMFDWDKNFGVINHQFVAEASVYAGIGISIASGSQKNEDRVLSMPLGNDGAWGFPIKFGGHIKFKKWFKTGLDVNIFTLLDKSKERRLKTDINQTEMFLLNKGRAKKNHGLQWQVHNWLTIRPSLNSSFGKGLFGRLSYQFVKHQEDRLFTRDNRFSDDIINTANSLKGWSVHNLIFQVCYDFSEIFDKTPITPLMSIFYKIPLAGKSIIDTDTWGGKLSVNF